MTELDWHLLRHPGDRFAMRVSRFVLSVLSAGLVSMIAITLS
jgi:hypothetical protein